MQQIQNIETASADNMTDDQLLKLNNLTEELSAIRKDRIKGMIIRSKIQWVEEGETPTAFFASLEKRNYVSKLTSTLNINGNVIQN